MKRIYDAKCNFAINVIFTYNVNLVQQLFIFVLYSTAC